MRAGIGIGVALIVGTAWAHVGHALARPMTPDDVASTQTAYAPVISPDGALGAYVISVPRSPHDEKDGTPESELHVARWGETSRVWVHESNGVSQLQWSPDGRRLGFVAKRGKDKAASLWAIPADGGEATRLHRSKTGVSQWTWSHDGAAAFIVRPVDKSKEDERRAKSGFDQRLYGEDWSPSELVRIAIPAALDEEAGEATVVAGIPEQPLSVAASPDGRWLAVTVAPSTLIDDRYMAQRMHWVDLRSGAVSGPVAHRGKRGGMEFAADSSAVAFHGGLDLHDPADGRLWHVPAGGLEPSAMLEPREADVAAIAPLGSGAFLLLTEQGAECRLERWSGPGSRPEVVFQRAGFAIRSMSVDTRGRRALIVADDARTPAAAYWLELKRGAEPRLVLDPNPHLADVDFAPQEVYSWTARDGLRVEGILIRPQVAPRGGRAPLLVYAHGGPESHVRNGWTTAYALPGQVAAARGYAVLAPNYRGSTGRGHAFVTSSQGDAGGKEFDDVIDGVDALIADGLVDGARVGITGGSYGGYMTGWAATKHTERFAAGVMFVGISNQLSKIGTTDIPNESRLVHWLTTPYDNLDLYLERSPVIHAGRANTPLLILHGERDTRVDPGQSRELYRAIHHKGDVPIRLVLYPREGHGNRSAASRYDYHLRMLQWFDHYLGGANGAADRKRAVPEGKLEYEAPAGGEAQ